MGTLRQSYLFTAPDDDEATSAPTPADAPHQARDCGCEAPPPSDGDCDATSGGGSLIAADIGGDGGGTGSLVDVNVAASEDSDESGTSLISADVGGDGGGSGSLVDLDIAPSSDAPGEAGSLLAARIAGGGILDGTANQGEHDAGIGLQVAALAGEGLLDVPDLLEIPGQPGSDGPLGGIVGGDDVMPAVTSLIGGLSLPDGLDLGGLLDESSC